MTKKEENMYLNLLRGQCAANERTRWIIHVKSDLVEAYLHQALVDPDSIDSAEKAMNVILESKIFDSSLLEDDSNQQYVKFLSNASYVLWKRGKEVELEGDSLYKKYFALNPTIPENSTTSENSTTTDLLHQAYAKYDFANKLFTSSLKASPSEQASIVAYDVINKKCDRNFRMNFFPNNTFLFKPVNSI